MAGAVRADEVAFRYLHDGHGLNSTSLSVEPGESCLIAGPSGCGKSTLARCLTGLIPHLYRGTLSGQVWLDGLCTTGAPLWELADRAGLVFQNPAEQMLATTVEDEVIFGLENLGLPPSSIRERLDDALLRFELDGLRSRDPNTLSGGEQQRLALAAVMARQPPVLVLDEPLSMLDGTAAADLVRHLASLASSGTTVVVCEHRREYLHEIGNLRVLALSDPTGGDTSAPAVASPSLAEGDPAEELALSSMRSGSLVHLLDVSQLTVRLAGRPILQGLSFSAPGGQVLAVVGRNGVGKTTLLRALAGMQPYEGQITIDGTRPDLGLVFQNADRQLFCPTVREEILYRVADPDPVLYRWLLSALGLDRYEGKPPLLLSEGEKKRVALATVLMRRPRHGILLDEPSVGQDDAHKARLVRLCRALASAGKLVILTTHDLPLAVQADRLALLGPDGFAADGPPAQVLADAGAWARLGLSVPPWVHADNVARHDLAGARYL